jgi:hypothetical protein
MQNTTHTIWGIIDGDGAAGGVRFGDCDNAILFEVSKDTDDGTYPRLCDYMRDINSLELNGVTHFINRLTRKKNKLEIDYDGVKIIRTAKWQDEAVLEFKEPIDVVVGKVGERLVIEKVKRIKGEFDHDYFWTRNGRQSKVANGYEIWFKIKEYLE